MKSETHKILGIPQDIKYDYEFMIVTKDCFGNYHFHSNHEQCYDAEKEANRIDGIIIHNLRVSGKKLKSTLKPNDLNN